MFPYESLLVYQKAFKLNERIYQHIKKSFHLPIYVKSQLGRSTLSIMLNIAEGSAKNTNKDRRNFFIIARASAFECASILTFIASQGDFNEKESANLKEDLEQISRILYSMIKNLEK